MLIFIFLFDASRLLSVVDRICSVFNLCCIWRVTRDSEHTVRRDVTGERDTIHVLGHSHWIWKPEYFERPYLMVHFIRHPYRCVEYSEDF